MPVSFVRLRIAGFKSFAEPATIEILPGLTGVVGPNGCGKSNVVEALRWAMGENSARALRGGEMDDVIFAGTANRPSRNLAEVTITLEDAAGVAPPPFHELHELQVSRRIERGAGSTYRINNREARARDVQTLFADLASGARASAMVSQGRVAAIVNARPEERRAVLEEAAGITGLHARRHEAELKLRAAEANLDRAEDLRGQLDSQLDGLRRQARQAARFRAMNGLIGEAERELFALARARTERDRAAATAAFDAAGEAAEAASAAARQAAGLAQDAAAALPALRAAEAESRARLERARVLREGAAEAARRAQAALDGSAARVRQIARDLGHAEQLGADADEALGRLRAEAAAIAAAGSGFEGHLARLRAEAAGARAAVMEADAAAQAATASHAASGALRDAGARRLADAQARARRAAAAAARADADHGDAASRMVDPARIAQADEALTALVAARAAAAGAHEAAERARAAAQPETARARAAALAADAAHAQLAAEAAGLANLLAAADPRRGRWTPVLDALRVPPGLELAVAAGLGEALDAATDREAARHWRETGPLPAPATPLGPSLGPSLVSLVEAPAALRRALAAIQLAEDDAAADAAQPGLPPGAVLVTREGGMWRWDGYVVRPGAPAAAAVRLQQRNRLEEVRTRLGEAESARTRARSAREQAEAAEREAAEAEARTRAALREAEPRVDAARAQLSALRTQHDSAAARLAAAADAQLRLRPELEAARAALAEAERDAAALPDPAAARAALERSRAALAAARAAEAAATRAAEEAARDHATRTARAAAIAAEVESWRARAEDAAARVADLRARAAEAEREHHALSGEPERVRRAQSDAAESLEAADSAHRRDSDALAAGQSRAETAARAERAADAALAAARESLVRAEAALTAADGAWGMVAERILERLGADPALPAAPADLSPEAEDRARRKLDRLVREREGMGPVNMRAEIEAEAIGAQVDAIVREREEIGGAINKLRGSIGHLNREGRARLAAVFTDVDRHFQSLFARMFGGGRAHLATVGSDDLLQAGLEIYAQPPGKKLATLSLLSGGEQALTALSLIFAIFRCNPAPICVLDEVDAPLDDANVERFCALLDDMVRETGTRFLVVTHHAHTMARMDRLFGVTMQERGVSRVLSVDLERATAMVERAAEAAA